MVGRRSRVRWTGRPTAGGSPEADHPPIVALGDESVACSCSRAMATPDPLVCAPGLITVTELATVKAKVAEPL